jgi:hypothetical protein
VTVLNVIDAQRRKERRLAAARVIKSLVSLYAVPLFAPMRPFLRPGLRVPTCRAQGAVKAGVARSPL